MSTWQRNHPGQKRQSIYMLDMRCALPPACSPLGCKGLVGVYCDAMVWVGQDKGGCMGAGGAELPKEGLGSRETGGNKNYLWGEYLGWRVRENSKGP
eukprot:7148733-Karenia_brevis.AAC.1